jgi:cytochrome d ubiquinol oxidase subunit II
MLVLHGAAWLGVKAEEGAWSRTGRRKFGTIAGIATLLLFLVGGLLATRLGFPHRGRVRPGRAVQSAADGVVAPGAWFDNFGRHPWMLIFPVLGFGGAILALLGCGGGQGPWRSAARRPRRLGIIATVGLSMFPFILPSTIDPRSSLTVWNASSSHLTLFIMLIVDGVLLPVVLLYTAWVFKVLWGRTSTAALKSDPALY